MSNQAAGMLHKMTQDGERFGSQHDALVVRGIAAAPKALIDGVQPKWGKLLHGRRPSVVRSSAFQLIIQQLHHLIGRPSIAAFSHILDHLNYGRRGITEAPA